MVNPQPAEAETRKLAEADFAEWIKTDILAEIIFEELESAGHEPTVENAKVVYLDILEDSFYESVKHCLDYNPAFQGKAVPQVTG